MKSQKIRFSLAAALGCVMALQATAAKSEELVLTDSERESYLSSARLYTPVNIPAQNTLVGPTPPKGFDPAAPVINCVYVERDPKELTDPNAGMSPKFRCKDKTSGLKLKVRYGVDNNEVYAQVVASRLLWALGFKAQKLYSSTVVCENCPVDPFHENPAYPSPRATRTFDPVTIQFRDAIHMGMNENQGWDWTELEKVSVAKGGSPRYELDAYRLLAAFIHHIDDQQDQQEMICEEADAFPINASTPPKKGCRQPWLRIGDLGATFGGDDFYMDLVRWVKNPIWKDNKSKNCKPFLDDTEKQFEKLKIKQPGADFLASLLRQLSQAQIRNLFVAARVDLYAPFMTKKMLPDGSLVPYSTDDWVAAFNSRVSQITMHQCRDN